MFKFFNRVLSYRRFLRLTPFDSFTEQGRQDERYRRVILSSLTMGVNRTTSLIGSFVTMYFLVPALGVERFGAINVILSYMTFILIFDFGIAAAIVNRVAHVNALDHERLRETVTQCVLILLSIGFVLAWIWYAIVTVLPWGIALKSHDLGFIEESGRAAKLSAPVILFSCLNTGLFNILLALQRGFVVNIISTCVNVIAIPATAIMAHYANALIGFLYLIQGAPIIIALIILFYLYSIGMFRIQISWIAFQSELRILARAGRGFFLITSLYVVAANLDIVLISSLIDPTHVSDLILVQRFFQILVGASNIFSAPLWSAYADAVARQDNRFIRRTFIKNIMIDICVIIIVMPPLIYYFDVIANFWTQGHIHPSGYLIVLVALTSIISIITGSFSIYLNGCGIIRPQVVTHGLSFVLGMIAKVPLALAIGNSGVVLAGLVAMLFSYIIVFGIFYREVAFRWLRRSPEPAT